MKKITLLILMLFLSVAGFSQVISEGFEGVAFPPTTPGNWAIFQNGFGSNVWTTNTTSPHTGTKCAQMNSRQNIGLGNTSKDFLATPLVTIPANGQLRFWARTSVNGNQGTKYQIRIASGALPANQTDETAYTTLVQEWTEDQLSTTYNIYEEKIVNLTAFAGQAVYIAFVDEYTQTGTTLSGDTWLLDDILLVEQCLDPTALAAGTFTTSSASLSWGNPSGATSWEIEVIPTAATPTGSGLVVGTNPYTATALTAAPFTPLQPGTCYKYYVRALCSVVGSAWVGPFTFCTATLGSTCLAPIVIPSTLPYVTNSNTSLYGNNITGPQGGGCAGGTTNYMTGNDVVYSYTAAVTTTITITMTPGSAWSGIFVYSSCANIGVSCLAGVANSGTAPRVISNMPVTAGQTYYIVISTNSTPVSTAYNLTIVANTCTNLAATFSVVSDCANGPQFFVRANVTAMGTATSVVATDNQASPAQTITAPGQVQFGPFPNGTNVTIHLENGQDANCFINSANQTQGFCPATNDLCSGAIPIACGGTATQTTVGATTTGAPTGTCGTTGGAGGLWYSFVGTGDIVTFSLCGSTYDTKLQVVTGACGVFTCVAGNDDSCGTQSQVVINSVLGTNYYVYVFGYGTAQGVFTLNVTCVPPPPPPANDNCTTAIVVPTNTTEVCQVSASGTTVGATPSTPATITPCLGTADDDVWFEFVATNTTHIINLTNIVGGTTNLNHILYSNTCGALTQMYCSDPNTSIATGLTIGTTYKIRVYTSGSVANQTATFNVCITVPPSNDECTGSILAPVNQNTNCLQTVSGTIVGATASSQANTCGATADDDDVWFHFVATATTHYISLLDATATLNYSVYTGNVCGSLTQVGGCVTGNGGVANGLIIGQTYRVRVYSPGTTAASTTFKLCIGTNSGTCPTALPLCAINPIIFPNNVGVPSTAGSTGCLGSAPSPTYYYLQIPISGNYVFFIEQNTNQTFTGTGLDVDFVSWGPYASNAVACGAINQGNTRPAPLGCSFSAAPTETFTVNGAIAGEVYVLMITNYTASTLPGKRGFIRITQTSGPVPTVCCPYTNFTYPGSFFCKDAANPIPTLISGATAGSYTSTPGLVINPTTGEIDLAASISGTYTVSNTVTGGGTCPTSVSTWSITITTPPVAAISYSAPAYCKADNTVYTVSQTGTTGGNYTASPLGGLSINPTTGSFNPSTSTPNTYTVTYTIIASGGCPTYTATAQVIITPIPVATFQYDALSYCQNGVNPVLSYTGGGTAGVFTSTAGLSIDASTGAINLSGSIPGSYTITNTILPSGGCASTFATFDITITAPPAADFSYVATPYCQAVGNPNPTPTMAVGAIAGAFSSTTGLIINPTTGEIDLAGSTPGTYTVENSIPAANGCAVVIATSSITITLAPNATIAYSANSYCGNDATVQNVTQTGTTGGTYSSTTGLSLDTVTGAITPLTSTPGAYIVTYTIAPTGGCNAFTTTFNITITAPAVATFSYTGSPYCQDSANPTPTFTGGGVAGTFSSTTGLVINPTTGEVNLAGSTPGTYTVDNFIMGTNGCADVTASATITITAPSTATISYDATSYCDNNTAVQNVTQTGTTGGTYSVTPTGLTIDTVTGDITPSTSTGGTYTVNYTIAASAGCPAFIASTSVTVIPDVAVEVVEECQGPVFTLTALPIASSFDPLTASYSWTGPNGFTFGPSSSPTVNIQVPGAYVSSVTFNGCTTNTAHAVADVICTIQKGISPNGDGENESFLLSDAKKLEIFSRYGTEVYSYTNYTDQWHGQSSKGEELPDGTYFYVIERNSGEKLTGWIYINR